MTGTGGTSAPWNRDERLDEDVLLFASRSVPSGNCTFVELFHGCFDGVPDVLGRPFTVRFASVRWLEGDPSGVNDCACLCPGRSGVTGVVGWLVRNAKIDCRWRTLGSDDGSLLLGCASGVTAIGFGELFEEPENFFAKVRKGDIERESAFAVLMRFLTEEEPFGGVSSPFFVLEVAVVAVVAEVGPEVVEPLSLGVTSPMRICRTDSISASVRDIRSRRTFQRWVDSACRRRHSPFLVTRSWTPLSMMERTFVVAGM